MPYCKSCGYELGDPHNDLHDPDGLSEMAQKLGEPVSNPDSAHLVVKDGEKGWRYYCSETGQVSTIVSEPPGVEGEGGGGSETKEEQPKRRSGEVYDLDEEKSALDVLLEVAKSPFLDLSREQLEELEDWAEDYNGQIPPDILVDIIGNFNGVNKQTAKLAKQKYEVKLNRWVRNQTQEDDGPPIGISQQPTAPQNGGQRRRKRPRQPQRQGGGGSSGQEQQKQSSEEEPNRRRRRRQSGGPDDLREFRRSRRVKRRNDALDKAAEKVADQMAEDMAHEMTGVVGDARDIFYTAIKRKVEKDPDWLLEKSDRWDVDLLDVFLEPSESRKEEKGGGSGQVPVDDEVDDVLNEVLEEESSEPPFEEAREEPQSEPPETTNNQETIPEDGELLEDMEPEEPEEEDDGDPFEEHFGEMEAEGGD